MSLSAKEKEMVAIGAALGANCIPCLQWHYKRCQELGFGQDEMSQAFAMAKKVKGVPDKKIFETAEELNRMPEQGDHHE